MAHTANVDSAQPKLATGVRADGARCNGPAPERLDQAALHALGRSGRAADLHRYIEENGSITIGEYMERYGVGQKRAIAELRRSSEVRLESGCIGRRKTDRYVWIVEDIINDVQESIGRTAWGFPYATREQIAEWIGPAVGTARNFARVGGRSDDSVDEREPEPETDGQQPRGSCVFEEPE
jgi:hypothetical protein